MTWTAQLTYTAGGLTSDDIAALTDALGDGGIVYGSDTGRLQITLEVEAPTLQDAADTVLRMTAAATGLLKLTRLQALTTAEFVAEIEHPPAMNLDAHRRHRDRRRARRITPARRPADRRPGLSRTGIAPGIWSPLHPSFGQSVPQALDGHQNPRGGGAAGPPLHDRPPERRGDAACITRHTRRIVGSAGARRNHLSTSVIQYSKRLSSTAPACVVGGSRRRERGRRL